MIRFTKQRSSFLCAFVFAGIFPSGGCVGRENAVAYKETESSFLRYPDDKKGVTAAQAFKNGPIFPMGVGSHWEMKTTQGPLSKDQGQSKEITITQRADEKIAITGETTLGSQKGMTFDIKSVETEVANAAKGKTTSRQEVYAVTKSGLFLLAAGGGLGRMTMSPPLPLVSFPVKEGQPASWNGVLHYQKATAPASSVSRISGVETIKTPATPKGVSAYRVDTILSTTLVENGTPRQVSFPTTRWLVPGIGMVRQKLLAGDQLVIKELKSFEIVGK